MASIMSALKNLLWHVGDIAQKKKRDLMALGQKAQYREHAGQLFKLGKNQTASWWLQFWEAQALRKLLLQLEKAGKLSHAISGIRLSAYFRTPRTWQTQCLVIHGPGGVGKSLLAQAISERLGQFHEWRAYTIRPCPNGGTDTQVKRSSWRGPSWQHLSSITHQSHLLTTGKSKCRSSTSMTHLW